MSDVQTQTEVQPIIYKPIFEITGMQSEDGIGQCNDSQAQTDLLAKHVIDKEEQDKSMPILQENEAQTNLMLSDVIDKKEQEKSMPILQETEAQTDLMLSDVIDKQEQEKNSPIFQDNKSQTNLIATDVTDQQEQNKEVRNLEYNKTQTNVISADVTDIPSTTDMLSEEVTQHKAEDKTDTGDNIDVQLMDTKGDMMPQDIPHQNNDDADQLHVNHIKDNQEQEDTNQPEDVEYE